MAVLEFFNRKRREEMFPEIPNVKYCDKCHWSIEKCKCEKEKNNER